MKIRNTALRCSGADGLPYDGDHTVSDRHYLVIEPSGRLKRFCDSDCLREHYALLDAEFRASLQAEERG